MLLIYMLQKKLPEQKLCDLSRFITLQRQCCSHFSYQLVLLMAR